MKRRGFTLIELMVAIVVLGILVAGVAFSVQNARSRAQDTAILSAARTIAAEDLSPLVGQFEQRRRFGGGANPRFLNGQLALNLMDGPAANVYNYRNPASGSGRIRPRGGTGRPAPAVFMTNRPNFRYENVGRRARRLERLTGTIVIWMSNRSPDIEVYYVDTRGRVSDFRWSGA